MFVDNPKPESRLAVMDVLFLCDVTELPINTVCFVLIIMTHIAV